MKYLLPTFVSTLLLSSTLSAQEYDNRPSVYIGIATSFLDSDYNLDDGNGFLLGGEYPVSERWSLAIEAWPLSADEDFTNNEADLDLLRVGGNYHLAKRGNWQPYLAVGVGSLELKPSIGTGGNTGSLDLGVGVKTFFHDNFFVRGDLKALHTKNATNLLIGISIGYAFGGSSTTRTVPAATPAAPVAAAAPVDTDRDGIADNADSCPNSPAGATVNNVGCEIDSDRDGVVDSGDSCEGTAMNLAVDNQGCPITEVVEHRIELLVNFDSWESVVKPEFSGVIEEFADFMKSFPESTAVIEGHTDTDGSESENDVLSVQRANAIIDALVADHGIARSRLSAVGFGELRPIASNDTPEGKARNRRIEAVLSAEENLQRQR